MTQHPTLRHRLDAQSAQAVALIHDWLDHALITPREALQNIAVLRQRGGESAAVADACKAAVQQWHDAQMEHTRQMMARGI